MKLFKKLAGSVVLFSGLVGLTAISPIKVKASTSTATCAASGSLSYTDNDFTSRYGDGHSTPGSESEEGMCYGTPAKYEITIYEMGICTEAPVQSSAATVSDTATDGFATTDFDTIDKSSCTVTTSGSTTGDLAGSSSFTLTSGTRPAAGEYEYAYIELGNVFVIEGEYAFTDGSTTRTFYSNGTSSGSTNVTETTGSTYTTSEFSETLSTFGGSEECVHVGREQFTSGAGGWLTAVVTDGTTVQTSCGASVNRIFGMFKPDTAFSVSDSVTGMEVSITVTNSGMSVIGDGGGGGIDQLGSGPFKAQISFIE